MPSIVASTNTKEKNILAEPTKEEVALAELRPRIADISKDNTLLQDDFYLLRWLINSNFNLERTEKRIRDTVKWRRDNDIDSLVKLEYDPALWQMMVIHHGSVTKEGVPIVYGTVRAFALYEKQRVVRHGMQMLAKFENTLLVHNRQKYDERCEREGRRIPLTTECIIEGFVIIDLEPIGFHQVRSPVVLQICLEISRNFINYYPGLFRHFCCIKISPFFNVCFKIIKPILSLCGMKVEGFDTKEENWKTGLSKIVDPDKLLKEWKENEK